MVTLITGGARGIDTMLAVLAYSNTVHTRTSGYVYTPTVHVIVQCSGEPHCVGNSTVHVYTLFVYHMLHITRRRGPFLFSNTVNF